MAYTSPVKDEPVYGLNASKRSYSGHYSIKLRQGLFTGTVLAGVTSLGQLLVMNCPFLASCARMRL